MQNDDNLFNGLVTTAEIGIGKTAEVLVIKEDSPFDSDSSAKYVGFSNIQESNVPHTNVISATTLVSPGEDTASTDLPCQNEATCNLDGSEEYNNLLNKYYEVENQRQQILQQLNRYSNWDYQYPFSSTSITEECQTFVHQPYETVACNCQYGCQNWVVPCNPSTVACSAGNYTGTTCHAKGPPNGKSGPKEVPDFLNTVMAAAEEALSLAKEPNIGKISIHVFIYIDFLFN